MIAKYSMKLYLYCSYTHSKRGFVLTQLVNDELEPVSLAGSEDPGEKLVNAFFSYDAFRILWTEYPEEKSLPVLPRTKGCLFGIRGLRGPLEDRTGIINFALLADPEEMEEMNRIASGIVANPESFVLAICSCLSIGGPSGYKADGSAIWEVLKSIQQAPEPNMEEEPGSFRSVAYSVRNMLKLAVYIGSWEQAAEYLHPQWIWKICPKQAISQEAFAQLYGKDLWQ